MRSLIFWELVSEAQWEEQQNANIAQITENDSGIVRLANKIIAEAYRLGASDIHIEPYADRKETAVRFRVDGSCFTYMKIPAAYRRAAAARQDYGQSRYRRTSQTAGWQIGTSSYDRDRNRIACRDIADCRLELEDGDSTSQYERPPIARWNGIQSRPEP